MSDERTNSDDGFVGLYEGTARCDVSSKSTTRFPSRALPSTRSWVPWSFLSLRIENHDLSAIRATAWATGSAPMVIPPIASYSTL